jgi:AmiR/NasT family two-component response regulator
MARARPLIDPTRVTDLLPTGRPLDDESWRSRHRAVVILVWAHAIGPPIVVLSGFTKKGMIDRAMALGAAGYIEKGRDVNEIPDILAATVGRAGAT